ncbi:hypothetical protein M3Y98_00400300 [Aphelenchoides besseyi]|nr:hypothetical protein M3Y98_00400300 [Aphelenchoides besseyi]
MFLNCNATPFVADIVKWQPSIELGIGVPNLILNIYFAFRFAKLGIFHPNLRIFMLTANLSSASVAILHPIVLIVPSDYYSIKSGNMLTIIFVYISVFLLSVAVLIFDIKFLMVGLERKFALNDSANYQEQNGLSASRYIIQLFTIMSIVILIKNAVVFYVSSTPNIDDRLMEAFLFEHCPVTGALTNLLAGLSLAYGIYHFYNLHRHTKSHRYKASTLTEIYNIHEAQTVIHVFIPLLIAYFVLAMFCAFMIYLDIYLLFFGGCTVHSFLYRFFVNLVYISVATYTLFSTIFMLFRFSAIRKLLLADLFVATGYRVCAPTRVAPKQLDSEQVQKQYFAELQRVWDQ